MKPHQAEASVKGHSQIKIQMREEGMKRAQLVDQMQESRKNSGQLHFHIEYRQLQQRWLASKEKQI